MNKNIKVYFWVMLTGLILSFSPFLANAEQVGFEAEDKTQVTAELCTKVNQYDDWQLVNDQWVSEIFEYQRYQWRAGKGYPVKESKFYQGTDYDQGSTETLMRLAQEGDKAANLELAQRHYYFSSSTPRDEKYCYMAVVDGFSAMTGCMITSYGEKVVKQMAKDQGEPSKKQFQLRLDVLGWIEFSKKSDDVFAQRFAEILKPGYQRDDISQAMIERSAQAIRNAINEDRKARKVHEETLAVKVSEDMPELWHYLEHNKLQEQVINGCFKEGLYAKQ